MDFLELLVQRGDKVDLNEMILVKKTLPARITTPIPACMYTESMELDYEVFNILVWVRAKRDNPEFTLQEVGTRVGMGNTDELREIVKEIYYFYTSRTREEVEELYQTAQEEVDEQDSENPPQPSPSNDS